MTTILVLDYLRLSYKFVIDLFSLQINMLVVSTERLRSIHQLVTYINLLGFNYLKVPDSA